MNNRTDFFSPDEFKKWLKETDIAQEEAISESNHLGKEALTKIGFKKLMEKIEIDAGDLREVCKEFMRCGGKIIGYEEGTCQIELESGSFFVNEKYIEIED